MPTRSLSRIWIAALAICAAAAFATPSADGAKPRIEYVLPAATNAGPMALAADDAVWFDGYRGTEHEGGSGTFLGRWLPGGELTTFAIPEGFAGGKPMTVGDDAWIAGIDYRSGKASGGEAVEYTPDGEGRRVNMGARLDAVGATTISGGDLWFAGTTVRLSQERNVIGSVPLSGRGHPHLIHLPLGCSVDTLTAYEGTVWFGEECGQERPSGFRHLRSSIGHIRVSAGKIVREPIRKGDEPTSSAVGGNGSIWFGIGRGGHYSKKSQVIRIDPHGRMSRFATPDSDLSTIAVGPGGRLWFDSSFGGQAFRALNSIGADGILGRPICIDTECNLESRGLLTDPEGGLFFAAGAVDLPGGGGVTGLLEGESHANQAGVIGRLGR